MTSNVSVDRPVRILAFPPDQGTKYGWHCDNVINDMWKWFLGLSRRERVAALAIDDLTWTKLFVKLFLFSSKKERRKEANQSPPDYVDGYKINNLVHIYDKIDREIQQERKQRSKKTANTARSASPPSSTNTGLSISDLPISSSAGNNIPTSTSISSTEYNLNNPAEASKQTEDDKDILAKLAGERILRQARLCSLGRDDPDTITLREFFVNDADKCLLEFQMATKQQFLGQVMKFEEIKEVALNQSGQTCGLGLVSWLQNHKDHISLADLLVSRIEFSLWVNYWRAVASFVSSFAALTPPAYSLSSSNSPLFTLSSSTASSLATATPPDSVTLATSSSSSSTNSSCVGNVSFDSYDDCMGGTFMERTRNRSQSGSSTDNGSVSGPLSSTLDKVVSLVDHYSMVDRLESFWKSQPPSAQGSMLDTTYDFDSSAHQHRTTLGGSNNNDPTSSGSMTTNSATTATGADSFSNSNLETEGDISRLFFLPLTMLTNSTANAATNPSLILSATLSESLSEEEIRKLIKSRIKQGYSDFHMFELEVEEDERLKKGGGGNNKRNVQKKQKKKASKAESKVIPKQIEEGEELSPSSPSSTPSSTPSSPLIDNTLESLSLTKQTTNKEVDNMNLDNAAVGLKSTVASNKDDTLDEDGQQWEAVSSKRREGKERSNSFGSSNSNSSTSSINKPNVNGVGGAKGGASSRSMKGNRKEPSSLSSLSSASPATKKEQTKSKSTRDIPTAGLSPSPRSDDIWKSFPRNTQGDKAKPAPSSNNPASPSPASSASSWRRAQNLDSVAKPTPRASTSTTISSSDGGGGGSSVRNQLRDTQNILNSTKKMTDRSGSNGSAAAYQGVPQTSSTISHGSSSGIMVSPIKGAARVWDGRNAAVKSTNQPKVVEEVNISSNLFQSDDPSLANMTKLGSTKGSNSKKSQKEKVEPFLNKKNDISNESSLKESSPTTVSSNPSVTSSVDESKEATNIQQKNTSIGQVSGPVPVGSEGSWPPMTDKSSSKPPPAPKSWAQLVGGNRASSSSASTPASSNSSSGPGKSASSSAKQSPGRNKSSSSNSSTSSKANTSSASSKANNMTPTKAKQAVPPQPPKSPWGNKVHTTLGMRAPSTQTSKEENFSQDDSDSEIHERRKSSDMAKAAAEAERHRRMAEQDEDRKAELEGRKLNQGIAVAAMEGERSRRIEEDLRKEVEAASEQSVRKEYASKQLRQEHLLKEKERRKGLERLHQQLTKDIIDFNKKLQRCMEPRRKSRASVVDAIDLIVKQLWPKQGHVKLYGSSFTGLDIPSSDVDIVTCGVGVANAPYVHYLAEIKAQQRRERFALERKKMEEVHRKKQMESTLSSMTGDYLSSKDVSSIAMTSKQGGDSTILKMRKPPMVAGEDLTDVFVKDGVVVSEDSVSEADTVITVGGGNNEAEVSLDENDIALLDDATIAAQETMEQILSTISYRSNLQQTPITSIQRLAVELAKQDWVVQIKSIESTSIPVIKILVNPTKCVNELHAKEPGYFSSSNAAASAAAAAAIAASLAKSSSIADSDKEAEEAADKSSEVWEGNLVADGLLAVDISFEGSGHGGVQSSKFVRELIYNKYPETIPLILVIKELLAQKHLNEPFTGGLSSYSVVLMVVALFQMWYFEQGNKDKARAFATWRTAISQEETAASMKTGVNSEKNRSTENEKLNGENFQKSMDRIPRESELNLGYLLTRFFAYFGREFDIRQVGLSIRRSPPGPFELPQVAEMKNMKAQDGDKKTTSNGGGGGGGNALVLSSASPFIEDPISNPARNVANSAFRFEQAIQCLFSNKLKELDIQGLGMLDQHQLNSQGPPTSPGNGRRQFVNGKVNVLKNIVMNY